ncbi:MAG: rhomboid family intramembrane serine protease [Pseudomonadota bacterium]
MQRTEIISAIRPILVLVAVIWAVEMVNLLLGYRLNQWFGLLPRSVPGLIGVPAMPFLHGGVGHAAANTLPLLVLGGIGIAVAPRRFWLASAVIVVVSGLAVWLLARPAIVVGASGLIFGWFGFVVSLAILERSFRALAGAVAVILLYGGFIWGVLPTQGSNVSWEAHLFGALAGAAAAWWLRHAR